MTDRDDYEARFMGGGGRVIHREKIVWRTLFSLLGGISLAAGAGSIVAFASPAPLFGLIPLFVASLVGACSVLFTVLRTVVTSDTVHVQQGFAGPKIPVARIEAVEIEEYDWKTYGGWGIKRSADGVWAYSMTGIPRGVRVTWLDERGERHRAFVSSETPERLRDAIEQARAQHRTPYRDGVRVEIDAQEPHEAEVEAGQAGGSVSRTR